MRRDARYYTVEAYLPEGWSADYNKTVPIRYLQRPHKEDGCACLEMVIHIGEKVDAINRIPVVIHSVQHAVPIYAPLVLLG